MEHISYKNGTLHVEDVALSDIARRFGTPSYVYSASGISDRYRAYERALMSVMPRRNFTICYACKANSNQAVLTLLQRRGAGADIVSGGELARALAAGIAPKKIVYSGVGKSEEELTAAIRKGLLQINVESREELAMISAIAYRLKKTVEVALRVNPDVDAGTHAKITTGKKENKFGIDIRQAPALYRLARDLPGISATGIAVHIGSQLLSLSPFAKAWKRVAELTLRLRAEGHDIRRIDIGGGLGISYRNETPPDLYMYALLIRDILLPLDAHIVLEPGRSIVGNSGVLLARVLRVKQGEGRKFLILDAAMNDLMRPALYDAYHAAMPVAPRRGRKTPYDVVGPVCETGDTFLKETLLPPLHEGDLVALMSAGAYGATMSSNYNTRPLAAEIMVQGKRAAAVRPRQGLEDLIAQDSVPAWIAG